MRAHDARQFDAGRAPAPMPEHALVRRLARRRRPVSFTSSGAKPAARTTRAPFVLRRARARWSRGRGGPGGSRRARCARRRRRRRRGTTRCPAGGSRRDGLRAEGARELERLEGLGRGRRGRRGRARARALGGAAQGRRSRWRFAGAAGPEARGERAVEEDAEEAEPREPEARRQRQRRGQRGRLFGHGASLPDAAPRAPAPVVRAPLSCPSPSPSCSASSRAHRVPAGLFDGSPRARRAHARPARRRGHLVLRDRDPARRHPRRRRPLPRPLDRPGARSVLAGAGLDPPGRRARRRLRAGGRPRPAVPQGDQGASVQAAPDRGGAHRRGRRDDRHRAHPRPARRARRGRARARHAEARPRNRARPVPVALAGLVAFDVHHRRGPAHGAVDGDGRGVLVSPGAADAGRGDALRGLQGAQESS